MDRICCTIIVAAAVVMLCMGYVEMMKMKSHYQTSTCGMKTVVPTQLSAKVVENETIPQKTKETHEFLDIDEEWPIEESECKHEEFKQVGDVLDKDFGNFLEDVSKTEKHKVISQFDTSTPNHENMKVKSNIRAVSHETESQQPSYAKNIGLTHPVWSVYHGKHTGKKDTTFGSNCTWFGGTDAYHSAREAAGH